MMFLSIFSRPTATAESPSTSSMLVIFEPITLPTTISDDPLITDSIEVDNSGNEVPNETSVTPITNGLIPI